MYRLILSVLVLLLLPALTQATEWTVGTTRCRNVGYFRATGRAVRHG